MGVYDDSKQVQQCMEALLECRKKDFRQVLEKCPALEAYAEKRDDKELLGFVYFYKGEAYYVLNEVEDMFKSMAKAVPYLEQTGQWELLARAYNMMAIISVNRGQASVALDYYLTALRYAKEHAVDGVIFSIHINVGYLYMQNKLYEEAKSHFFAALAVCEHSGEKKAQIGRWSMLYTNLATCYMLCGDMEQAGVYVEHLMEECSPYFNNMDHVYVGCMTARYYHMCTAYEKRDRVIQDILERLDGQLPLADLFDDLYSLCELTLEMQAYDIFAALADKLEPVVAQTGLINLHRKILELQIQYYEKMQYEQKRCEAVSRFYQMIMVMEKESHKMIANMMQVRTALEAAQESKRQMEEMNAVLMHKSHTDALSGLANRYRMMEVFEQMLAECRRDGKFLGTAIIDIDYFKEYNDNYGHQAGDECIRQVAAQIKAMQNERIFCVRYGGDEFVVVFAGLTPPQMLARLQELRAGIVGLHIEHAYSKTEKVVTISQGLCIAVPTDSEDCLDFLHMADEYLYQVKRQRRNRICVGDMQKNEVEIL